MRREWYEKYIGYCFTDNGKEVILEDVCIYEDGRKCYELSEKQDDGTYRRYITDYQSFKLIAKQTSLPRR